MILGKGKRIVYAAKFADTVYVLHALQKKTQQPRQ